MKLVLTGSAGRIGRAIHSRLSGEHEVVGIDRVPAANVRLLGDFADPTLLACALAGADAVIHCAALHAPQVGAIDATEFQRINVDGTQALVDAARAAGVRRIVFTSTTALYGRASSLPDRAAWIDESVAAQPLTTYHRTKLQAEALLREAALSGGPQVRILRMSRCFPEPAPLMAQYRLHRGVDARDVAQAHALALVHAGGAHATWVISGTTPFLREDAIALRRDAPSVLRERAPDLVAAFAARGWPLPDAIDRVYDAGAAQRELGWRPVFGFEEVLAQRARGDAEVLL